MIARRVMRSLNQYLADRQQKDGHQAGEGRSDANRGILHGYQRQPHTDKGSKQRPKHDKFYRARMITQRSEIGPHLPPASSDQPDEQRGCDQPDHVAGQRWKIPF